LFIGVKLALEVVNELRESAEIMRAATDAAGVRMRWVPPAGYHVTLKFLGEVRDEALEQLRDVIGARLATEPAPAFRVRGAGAFPDVHHARVLWAGVDDPGGGLARLAAACDVVASELGFACETRAFHPHVTIGRLRQVANVEAAVLACTEQGYSETRAPFVTLFRSVTKSSGSEYVAEATWPLRQTERVELAPTIDHRDDH
jgi:2'-5' RNA ligase